MSGANGGQVVTEEEMTRAEFEELEERVASLEKAVKENSHRLDVHSTIGWIVLILWLLGIIASVYVVGRILTGWRPW